MGRGGLNFWHRIGTFKSLQGFECTTSAARSVNGGNFAFESSMIFSELDFCVGEW